MWVVLVIGELGCLSLWISYPLYMLAYTFFGLIVPLIISAVHLHHKTKDKCKTIMLSLLSFCCSIGGIVTLSFAADDENIQYFLFIPFGPLVLGIGLGVIATLIKLLDECVKDCEND